MSVLSLFRFARQRARISPGRASHFGGRITSLREVSVPPLREHLLAQMKVTKAKGQTAAGHLVFHEGSVGHDHGPAQAGSSKQMNSPNAVRALFLGDFFLGQQKEVTRLPGGTGAVARRAQVRRQGEQQQRPGAEVRP